MLDRNSATADRVQMMGVMREATKATAAKSGWCVPRWKRSREIIVTTEANKPFSIARHLADIDAKVCESAGGNSVKI